MLLTPLKVSSRFLMTQFLLDHTIRKIRWYIVMLDPPSYHKVPKVSLIFIPKISLRFSIYIRLEDENSLLFSSILAAAKECPEGNTKFTQMFIKLWEIYVLHCLTNRDVKD